MDNYEKSKSEMEDSAEEAKKFLRERGYITTREEFKEKTGIDLDAEEKELLRLEEEKKARQEKRRRRWKRLRVLIVIVLLISSWIIAGKIVRSVKIRKAMKESGMTLDLMGIAVPSMKEYDEYLKSEMSDISGMTRYDKLKMGLQISDGSDSDMDGLTDKEEIEVYGTNPLLASTAGDLYRDGYKVEHGMDLFTFYEYEGDIEFVNNECPEVILTADIPSDLNAVVKDYKDVYSLSKFGMDTVYAGYWLYNYSGKVSLDLTDVMSDDIQGKDLQVMIAEGSFVEYGLTEFKKCSFECAGNVIALDYDFDKSTQYYVYVVKKILFINKITSSIGGAINEATNSILGQEETSSTTGKAVLHGSIALYWITKKGLTIEYTELDTKEDTELFLEQVIKYYGGENYLDGTFKDLEGRDSKVLKPVSKEKLNSKYGLMKKIFSSFEFEDLYKHYEKKDWDWWKKALYMYAPYSFDVSTIKDSGSKKSDFDKMVDELCFGNFGSYISNGGNCAGISHLTAYLYNTKSFPESGSYSCRIDGERKEITWDLTTDSQNVTLMDAGLADYKEANFVAAHSSNGDAVIDMGLSSGEEEFINMVGCLWAEGNETNHIAGYIKRDGEKNRYKIVRDAKKYIDEGKILDVYLYFLGNSGHAINIYGYKEISKDEIWFYVYDSNIPQDASGLLIDDACYLKVKKISGEDGKAYFDYLYWPLGKNSPKYLAASDERLMPASMIMIMDENWNVFQ